MQFGKFENMESINPTYNRIKELGLESHVIDIDTYGFTVIPPEKVAPPEFLERIRATVLKIAEERTGVALSLDANANTGNTRHSRNCPGSSCSTICSWRTRYSKSG